MFVWSLGQSGYRVSNQHRSFWLIIAVWSEGFTLLSSYEHCGGALLSRFVVSSLWRYCSDSRFCTPGICFALLPGQSPSFLVQRSVSLSCRRAVGEREAFGMGRNECRNRNVCCVLACSKTTVHFIHYDSQGRQAVNCNLCE